MTPHITLSDAAYGYIKHNVLKNKSLGFRLSVKKTGCSGYAYLPSLIDEINTNDVPLVFADFTVFIDRGWIDLLQGVQVDYKEEDKTGLKQKRLVFTNPNEANRCGCGESFHIE